MGRSHLSHPVRRKGEGLEKVLPEKSIVDVVGPFEPLAFGFNGAKKGVKPADLQ